PPDAPRRRRGARRRVWPWSARSRSGTALTMARPPCAGARAGRVAAIAVGLMPTPPAFWGEPRHLLADLLLPIGAAWDAAGRLRRTLTHPYYPPVPVVCVGNLVAGGAGKTPVALAIASYLAAHGAVVHVVTRGYGGRLRGPILVDPDGHDADAVGDEALLLALRASCWVARDRAVG